MFIGVVSIVDIAEDKIYDALLDKPFDTLLREALRSSSSFFELCISIRDLLDRSL